MYRLNIRPIQLFGLFGLALLGGCQSAVLPDLNDPHDVGALPADRINDRLADISNSLQLRVYRGEITDAEAKDYLEKAAISELYAFNPDSFDVSKAWLYGQILITAHRWNDAEKVLRTALESDKIDHNEDRRVNDTLRLARVEAELGKVPDAIKTARSVFNIAPEGLAPILYACVYEIGPAARGKGHDLEVAQLLKDAIVLDMKVKVDVSTIGGENFIQFRPRHIQRAWKLIVDLYKESNRPDLAAKAEQNLQPVTQQEPTHRVNHV